MSDPIFDKLLASEQNQTGGAAPSGTLFDSLMGIEQRKSQQFLGQIDQALGVNPDKYSADKQTAKLLARPVAAVEALPQDAERDAKVKTLQDNTANAPVLKQQYTDADFAKLAHDDSAPLSAIEALVGAAKYVTSAPDAPRGGLLSDIGMAARSIASGAPRLSGGIWGAGAAVPGLLGLTDAEQWMLQQQKNAQGLANRIQGLDPKAGLVEKSVMSGFQSAGQNLVMLPFGLARGATEVGTNAILTMMGISTGGESYAKAREKGVSPYQAAAYGIEDAAAEVVFEKYLGVGGFLQNVKAGAGAGKLFVYELSKELPGEVATTLVQNFNEWGNVNPDKSVAQFLSEQPEAIAQTVISTLVGGGTQIGAIKTAEKVLGTFADTEAQMQQAEAQRAMLEQLSALAASSKLKARDTETFQRFMDAATDGTPVQDLYISGQVLMQSGIGEQLAQALPTVAEQLPAALASDGFVRIPTAQYAAVIAGSEFEQSIIDHVKVDPNGYTFAESKEYAATFNQEMQTQLERAFVQQDGYAEFKASQERVKQRVLDDLNRLGRFAPGKNEIDAALIAARSAVRGAQLGMTAEQFFEKQLLRFATSGRKGSESKSAPSIDSLTDDDWFKVIGPVEGPARPDAKHDEISADEANLLRKMVAKTIKNGVAAGRSREQIITQIDALTKGGIKPSGYQRINELIDSAYAGGYQVFDQTTLGDLTDTLFKDQTEEERKAGYANRFKNPVTLADGTRLSGFTDPVQQTTFHGYNKNGERLTIRRESVNPDEIVSSKDSNRTAEKLKESLLGLRQQTLNQSADERDLIVTHNLTAANLLHAVKIGGIPVPSLAVTKKDTPLTGFGEITLIGEKAMADPQGYAGTKVFGADIYSPRYPSVTLEFTPNMRKRGEAQLKAGMEATDTSYIEWSEVEREGGRELERNSAFLWDFLTNQGMTPEVKRVEAKPLPPAIAVFAGDTRLKHEFLNDPAFVEAAWQAHLDLLTQVYDGDIEAARAEIQADRARAEERGRSQIVSAYADDLVRYQRDVRENGKIDREATRYAMQQQVRDAGLSNQLEQAANQFIQDIGPNERIFQGFTNAGNRKYIPHTLENVVKILKKELRGGENFNYGVGSLRAKFTPQFKSVEQIRKAKKRLVNKTQMEKIKEEIDNDLFAISESFGHRSLDTTISMLEDTPKMGLDKAAKSYDAEVEISDEQRQQVGEFLARLKNLPTEYFEAKILREVDLAEFAGAVVPEGVDPKVIEALQARGVKDIRTYAKGDEADRAAKIGEFENLFFQNRNAPRGGFVPDTNTMLLLKDADLSTFLHESGHYFFEGDIALAAEIVKAQRDGASISDGEQQILNDVSALLKWHGLNGDIQEQLRAWYTSDFEERRVYHERTAESFEAYLFDGKAPSMELQPYFQKFRAWLFNVYRSLKDFLALNPEAGKLNDEVRAVFDRMLATNEQIEAAEAARNMGPLFNAQNAQGLIDDWQAYHSLANEATLAAVDQLQAKSLKELQWASRARTRALKDLQRQHNAIRAELKMEARREVMSQPVYRAWQFLTGKLSKEDRAALKPERERKSLPGTLDPSLDSLFVAIAKLGGLDRAQVESTWGWDKKERTPSPVFGKPLLRREGGMGIDAMGELLAQYGYLPTDEHGKYDMADFEEAFDAEYRGTPVYSIEHDYAGAMGEYRPGEGLSLENIGAGRFDVTSLKMVGVDDAVIDRLAGYNMTGKDGIHPDIVAELIVDENGVPVFSSGNELAQRLADATPPKVAIEKLTDQMMLERFGELATPEAIQRAADEAVHNELRAKMLHAEARALERAMEVKAPGRRGASILPQAARDFAQRLVAGLKVRDIRPAQYAAAEVRAAKAAERAFAKNDLEGAAEQKRIQIVNNYATREAYAAQDEVRSAVAYLRKFEKRSKSLDPDYYDQIVAILERFDLVPSTTLKAIDKRTSLAGWLTGLEEQGIVPDIPAELAQEAFRKSYKDMTVEELRGLRDTIKQIDHMGRLKAKLLTAQDEREFAAIRDDISESIRENSKGRIADNRTPNTVLGEKLGALKKFWASHIKAATWARIMDGGKDGGPVWEYLIRTANAAGDKEVGLREQATKELSALVAPVLAEGKMGGKGEFFPSIGRSLNKEARLAIALNIGNESNAQRLLGGEGWTVEQIKPVLDTLTTADWRFVQSVWDYFESYRPEIAAKERRVYGAEPQWIEAQPLTVQTRDGDTLNLRGGYYPVKYDPRASERAESHMEAEDAKRMMQGAYTSATTRRSFTKQRADAVVGRPLLYSLDGLYNGVNEVIHDLSWHEWLIDANRIIKNPKIAEAMRDTYGAEVHQQFKNWLKDVAEGERGAQKAGEDALAWIRQGTSVAGLGLNVMSALMQPFGITQSWVRVGGKWIGRGISKAIADPVGVNAEINEMSEFMRTRSLTRMRELAELRNQVKGQTKTRANIDAAAYALMLRAQQLVDVPTWWGAYEKAVAEGNGQERAAALADQAVIDAQGGGTVKDLSAIERGGPALKLFTTFYSFMNTSLNLGVAQAMTRESKAKLAADMLLIYVAPVILIELMKSAFTPGDSGDWEDPEKAALKMLKAEVSYLFGLVFGLREMGGIVDAFQGKPGGEYSGPAGTRIIGDTLKLAKQIGQGEMDDGLRKSIVNVTGELLRLPAAQVNRSITGAKALIEGDTKNPAALVFGYEEPH